MSTTLINAPTGDGSRATLKAYSSFEPYELADYLACLARLLPDVAIEIERMPTVALTGRLAQERDNPQADLVLGWADTAARSLDFTEQVFAPGADADGWLRVTGFSTAFVTDPALLAQTGVRVDSWADLTQRALYGRIAFPNPAISGAGFLALATLLQRFGEEEGWHIVEGIYRNVRTTPDSAWEPARLTGEGEIAVGVTVNIAATNRQRELARLAVVQPRDVVGVESEVYGAFTHTRHNLIVREVLEWIASAEAKTVYAGYNKILLGQPDSRLFTIDAKQAVASRERWLARLDSIAKRKNQ